MWGKISIIFLSVFVLGLSGFSQNVNAETILICQVPSNPMNAAGSPYILDTDLCGTKVIIPSSQTLVLESGAVFEIRSTTTVGGLLNFGTIENFGLIISNTVGTGIINDGTIINFAEIQNPSTIQNNGILINNGVISGDGNILGNPIVAQDVITFPFKGVLIGVNLVGQGYDALGPSISEDFRMGTQFSGQIKFASNAPNNAPINTLPPYGEYDIIEFEVTIGSSKFVSTGLDAGRIFVTNQNENYPGDTYSIHGENPIQLSGTPVTSTFRIITSFADRDGTIFDDLSLPASPPDISQFEHRVFTIELLNHEGIDGLLQITGPISEFGVLETLTCGPGTTFNPSTNQCGADIVQQISCGEGTIPLGTECVVNPTLTQQNADLQTQVDSLTQQNADLQTQVDSLTQQVSDLNNQITNLLSQIGTIPNGIISSLVSGIQSLVDGNNIDDKDSKKAMQTLQNSLKDLEKGNTKACKDVSKFLKEMDKLVLKGKLSQSDAQALIDDAEALIATCP